MEVANIKKLKTNHAQAEETRRELYTQERNLKVLIGISTIPNFRSHRRSGREKFQEEVRDG